MKNTNLFALFYKRIEELRKEKGYTKKYVCKKIGISEQTYQNWIKGHTNEYDDKRKPTSPSSESIIGLSLLYHKSIDYLMGYTDFTSKENESISSQIGLTDDSINMLHASMGVKNDYVIDMLNEILKNVENTQILYYIRQYISCDDDMQKYIWMGYIVNCLNGLKHTE